MTLNEDGLSDREMRTPIFYGLRPENVVRDGFHEYDGDDEGDGPLDISEISSGHRNIAEVSSPAADGDAAMLFATEDGYEFYPSADGYAVYDIDGYFVVMISAETDYPDDIEDAFRERIAASESR